LDIWGSLDMKRRDGARLARIEPMAEYNGVFCATIFLDGEGPQETSWFSQIIRIVEHIIPCYEDSG